MLRLHLADIFTTKSDPSLSAPYQRSFANSSFAHLISRLRFFFFSFCFFVHFVCLFRTDCLLVGQQKLRREKTHTTRGEQTQQRRQREMSTKKKKNINDEQTTNKTTSRNRISSNGHKKIKTHVVH